MDVIKALEMIKAHSGNAQLERLAAHPELKDILEWTYNPFKKYYITAPDIEYIPGNELNYDCFSEDGNLLLVAKEILSSLNSRILSGNEAINRIQAYTTILHPDSALLFSAIINKDLRLGIGVSSINKIWPGLIPISEDGEGDFKIMYVKNYKEGKMPFPCLAAPKLDGVRGRYYNGKLYSRQRKLLVGLEHIEQFLDELCEREGIEKDFDGELTVPGDIFDSASGLIRNNKPVPEAVFNIFDMPGDPRAKKLRLAHLSNIFDGIYSPVRMIEHVVIMNRVQLDFTYDEYLSNGHEGIVIYDPDTLYEEHSPTRRTNSWMRIVPLKTADCIVIGFYEGKGKLVGSLGGIIVDYKGHKCRVGSGFAEKLYSELSESEKKKWNYDEAEYNHKLRINIWNNKMFYLTQIAECEFKEETKAGSMRQPRFKSFRFDKTEPNVD